MTRTQPSAIGDPYMALIRECPLRPVRGERDHNSAMKTVRRLLVKGDDNLTVDEADYLEALVCLVKAYEAKQHRTELSPLTPLERLRFLMKESGMTQAELGRLLGGSSAASMVLSGQRQLSKTHIRTLADHFRLERGYFL
jgi:HTH-type transcriptional regulator/antitoxin HigA